MNRKEAVILFALILAVAPYTGPTVTGLRAHHATFSVAVHGASRQTVRLQAIGVPNGYIASFCTNRVCAPMSVVITLPISGRASIELQLIKNTTGATDPKFVTVAADGARPVRIAFSRGLEK